MSRSGPNRQSRGGIWPAISAGLLIALLVLAIAPRSLLAQEKTQAAPLPDAVTKAIEAAPPAPDEVSVGAYINDIHELDFRSHTYSVDLYIWFRWRDESKTPVKTMEFMNRYSPTDHQRDSLLDEPKKMPDGSFYGIIREQGRFASKFRLEKYPFDQQTLRIVFEDTVASIALQKYTAAVNAVTANPDISLPGYRVGAPRLIVSDNHYPTNFGDVSLANNETYSRVSIEVPVTRPLITVSIKTFVPILLIIMSSTLVLFVRPSFVEGRIGLAITALLTLVALQLTASASLPEVDYLMLIDKAYLASYAFIIAVLTRVVATSWVGGDSAEIVHGHATAIGGLPERVVAHKDARWALLLQIAYWLIVGASVAWTMTRF